MHLRQLAKDQAKFQVGDRSFNYLPLVQAPTPVEEASYLGARLFIKREDKTDTSMYGGNKVRNLEFILAKALDSGATRVATPIPVGSNFSAAFTAHALKVGLVPRLCQVYLATHSQIEDHQAFCVRHGAEIVTRSGPLKFPQQAYDVGTASLNKGTFFVAPGGSNFLGVLGHIKASFEFVALQANGEIPDIDVIYVGAGTGGTVAGLLAGLTLKESSTRVIAVRCAEKVICNRTRILRLATKALRSVGSRVQVDPLRLELVECPGSIRYGYPLMDYDVIAATFLSDCGIELDRTYTSKVIKTLTSDITDGKLDRKNVLYWHTYSPMASRPYSA